MRKRVLIMGAAGRDFHNFNVLYSDNPAYEVAAFTATQIPNIEGRRYPAKLAGKLYPKGIPVYAEERLAELIKKHKIDHVVFSYSDISYTELMQKASIALAAGADFVLHGAVRTMIKSKKPVISVCAVRTGCGKSQTSRAVVSILKDLGKKAVAVRHPMPYGNLLKQAVQRFEKYGDFRKNDCTIEEMEEYEPYTERGLVVYAGVDYGEILKQAEREADIIVWDGGNNDTPFYKPDVHIVVADPHRPNHEILYYPGQENARMADIVIINKVNTAKRENIETVKRNITAMNPKAKITEADSVITVERPEAIKGKSVIVVEDGPTLTHGEMAYGAGTIAAQKYGCILVDPREHAVGSIKATFAKFRHLGNVLPAMGYGEKQIRELEQTINAARCDAVIVGTPVDLGKLLKINKPAVRVRYDLGERAVKEIEKSIRDFLKGGRK